MGITGNATSNSMNLSPQQQKFSSTTIVSSSTALTSQQQHSRKLSLNSGNHNNHGTNTSSLLASFSRTGAPASPNFSPSSSSLVSPSPYSSLGKHNVSGASYALSNINFNPASIVSGNSHNLSFSGQRVSGNSSGFGGGKSLPSEDKEALEKVLSHYCEQKRKPGRHESMMVRRNARCFLNIK